MKWPGDLTGGTAARGRADGNPRRRVQTGLSCSDKQVRRGRGYLGTCLVPIGMDVVVYASGCYKVTPFCRRHLLTYRPTCTSEIFFAQICGYRPAVADSKPGLIIHGLQRRV